MEYIPKIEQLIPDLNDIGQEYINAKRHNKKFNSFHEAYAVLLEEVDELWEAIKDHYPVDFIKGEAKQVAAMALGILFEFDD